MNNEEQDKSQRAACRCGPKVACGGKHQCEPMRTYLVQGSLVVAPVRLDLGWRQTDGDVDGHFFQSKLDGRLVVGVADDNLALLVHDDGLSPSELLDRLGDRVDSGVIDARSVVRVRPDFGPFSYFVFHGYYVLFSKWLGVTEMTSVLADAKRLESVGR